MEDPWRPVETRKRPANDPWKRPVREMLPEVVIDFWSFLVIFGHFWSILVVISLTFLFASRPWKGQVPASLPDCVTCVVPGARWRIGLQQMRSGGGGCVGSLSPMSCLHLKAGMSSFWTPHCLMDSQSSEDLTYACLSDRFARITAADPPATLLYTEASPAPQEKWVAELLEVFANLTL